MSGPIPSPDILDSCEWLEAKVAETLRQRIGLKPDAIDARAIPRAVRAHMAERDVADPTAYIEELLSSDAVLEQLAEKLVVLETWFFRDVEPFVYLGKYILSEWLPGRPDGPLRILSAPCSTGEEPYTVAMTLLDLGLPPTQFEIDGVDISTLALNRAESGTFDKNSFRTRDVSFKQRYFTESSGNYTLVPHVRDQVGFHQGNIINHPPALAGRRYDIIFCRNLWIYLDHESQQRCRDVLDSLLKRGGLFFTGAAEAGLIAEHYESVRHPCSFAYRKGASPPASLVAQSPAQKLEPTPRRETKSGPKGQTRSQTSAPAASEPATPKYSPLELAQQLADRGDLAEAARLCDELLAADAGSAAAHFLLGVIHQAAGDDASAEASFERALYLDPDHFDALIHLSFVARRSSDSTKAERLQRRAERILSRLGEALSS